MFAQSASKTWILLNFKVQQKEIAKTLCVRKEFKYNTCQGSCQLNMQLKTQDGKEQKSGGMTFKDQVEILFLKSDFNYELTNQLVLSVRYVETYYHEIGINNLHILEVFRPPNAC